MRNGDPRSPAWVQRHLPAYRKDNKTRTPDDIQMMLAMVIHDELVPLAVIAKWTDEQRMLADDWAMNVHLRASDNINRVPAKPDFLKDWK